MLLWVCEACIEMENQCMQFLMKHILSNHNAWLHQCFRQKIKSFRIFYKNDYFGERLCNKFPLICILPNEIKNIVINQKNLLITDNLAFLSLKYY